MAAYQAGRHDVGRRLDNVAMAATAGNGADLLRAFRAIARGRHHIRHGASSARERRKQRHHKYRHAGKAGAHHHDR